ncbi:MAG: xylulokinase [Naasia sp.]|uniref:xylulokinase n=1 Tax=Naasia sp. TaxID=2546198 RepID=UPI00261A2831|nr:xylulokinase [Naasia sp.]MCU1571560.1 xylulokinase [Naasia sp.]
MIVAHDLGTTGDKASLHAEDGRLLSAVTVSYPAHFGDGGLAEQDPEAWWHAVVQATRTLLEQNATPADAVSGLVVSGQMMGAVLLDADYRPVRPAIIWADTRSTRQTAQLEERLAGVDTYRLLGHRLNPTYSVEKIMWVRDNEPDVFARVRHFCVAKDFVVQRLTGRLATDRSDASATNAYDQAAGHWSPEVLAAAELDRALFPEIVESTTVVGGLTGAAADALGLSRHTPVVMGGGDGPIAAVGAGIVAPEDGAYVCLGTSSWISFASDSPVYDPARRTFTFDNVVPGSFVPTATMQAGGAAVQWAAEVLAVVPSPSALTSLVDSAQNVEAAATGLYFLPYLLGERSPHWNPDAAGVFLGLGRHHGPAELMRAVLEGVALNLFTCITAFREAGASIERIDAIGGGAASDVWLQIFADVWGVPVRRRSVVEEANSLGAAVTGAVALGLVPGFSAAHGLSEVTAEFAPDPGRHDLYLRAHEIFADGYDRLVPWFGSRAAAS